MTLQNTVNNSILMKKNEAITHAQKFIKKGQHQKALRHYYKALKIMPSANTASKIMEIEEKVIRKSFRKEYDVINCSVGIDKGKELLVSSSKFLEAVNRFEDRYQLWAKEKKLSYFIKTFQWEKADSLWSYETACLLHPSLAGRYLMEKKEYWETFLSWQFLLYPDKSCKKKISEHMHQSVNSMDLKRLVEGLERSATMKNTFLLAGLDLRGVQWLFEHLSRKAFKTIIYRYLRFLVYEGRWVKGGKVYSEMKNKYKNISWTDTTGETLELSLQFWKILYSGREKENDSGYNDRDEKMTSFFDRMRKAKISLCPDKKSKESLLNYLSEYVKTQWGFKNESFWTVFCTKNPYKLMGIDRHMDERYIMPSFARTLAEKKVDLRELLNVQRALLNPQLKPVLSFLFFPL